jgi:hypothetical protein
MPPSSTGHANNDHADLQEPTDLDLIIALYQQGRSARDVGDLMEMSAVVVNNIVRAAGVIRTPQEANRLASRRLMARNTIAKLDIKRLAERWLGDAEVEELADELDVPADLLWDALAAQLSTRGGVTRAPKLTCAGTCSYGCSERCAITAPVHDRAVVPGTPRSTLGRQGQGERVPYVRTGLQLPERGQYTRWQSFE